MTKQTPKEIEAAIARFKQAQKAALFQLDNFMVFIRTIDPELSPSEAMMIAGYALSELPDLFRKNPSLVDQIKDIATKLKLERSNISNS